MSKTFEYLGMNYLPLEKNVLLQFQYATTVCFYDIYSGKGKLHAVPCLYIKFIL
jgi:hypothetical protein